MFKKMCVSLGVVLGLVCSGSVSAQVCGDGGQLGKDVDGVTLICVGGTLGAYRYGGHPRDGLGPLPVDNRGGNATNNSGNGGSGNLRGRTVVRDSWGAVAFDASRSSFGHAVNTTSKLDAENTAISDCGGQSCRIMAAYKNSCAAFAGGYKATGGTYAVYKWHINSVQKAESLALSACSKKAKNCQILVSECSVVGQ